MKSKNIKELMQEIDLLQLKIDELSRMSYLADNFFSRSVVSESVPNNWRMQNYASHYKSIYIYGAGQKGERIFKALNSNDFKGFVVSNLASNANSKFGFPVFEFSDILNTLKQQDSLLIIALNPKNLMEVLPLLVTNSVDSLYFAE